MNSFSSDSLRIALLGITFEFSRYVAREAMRTIAPALDARRIAESEHCSCEHASVVRGKCDQCGTRRGNKFNLLERCIQRLQQSSPLHRYFALGSWLLLSPTILFLCSSKLKHIANKAATAGSLYLTSIVTSLGVVSCLYPELMSANESQYENTVTDLDATEKIHSQQIQIPTKPPPPPVLIPRKEAEEEYRPRSDSLLSQHTEVSTYPKEKPQKHYLEILVHNVSHTDLILGLSDDGARTSEAFSLTPKLSIDSSHKTPCSKKTSHKSDGAGTSTDEEKYILCRPRFSAFDMFSRRVKTDLAKRRHSNPILSYPRYERSNATARYTLVTPRPGDQSMLPVGFNLEKSKSITYDTEQEDELAVDANDMPSLRVRGRDIYKINPPLLGDSTRRVSAMPPGPAVAHSESKIMEKLRINAVFFPLLSTLLPRWLGHITDRLGKSCNVKKVVVLVSGVGSPRNWTHSAGGNSTQVCTDLMEQFIHQLFPDVTVIKIHSQTNIFRYDENISFATQELMPCIDSYRDAHARCEPYPDEVHIGGRVTERNPFNPDWRQTVSIAYSFADGSAARTHAIQSALRPYRPTYFHFWQLKTFWHASKVTTEDIEVHSFEEMETVPAIAVDMTSGMVQKVINEMKNFRADFLDTLKGGKNDLSKFWLRKSKKPVLAVLLVQGQNGEQIMYRGTNMEVSMPTGSLCAERNAIGTALAADPSLKREDLLMVAVLSVQLPPSPPPLPESCCHPTNEGLDRIMIEVSEKLKLQPRDEARRSTSISSIAEANVGEEWEMDIMSPPRNERGSLPDPMRLLDGVSSPSADDGIIQSGASTPKHHISLYKFADPKSKAKLNRRHNHLSGISNNKKRLILVQSPEDINPLKPCGACNEWLKKIAESNPHFKVLTFTDELCNGVYVSPCQE